MILRSPRDADANRFVSVDMLERLAIRYMSDEQLIDLLARLEQELLRRTAPIEDQLLAEHPRSERG